MNLSGKNIIITGGGSGLGRSIAESVAREGAHVIICGHKMADVKNTCAEIRKDGGMCDYAKADVTSKKQVESFFKKVKVKYKKIDALINNAGWTDKPKSIEKITDREYAQYVGTNFNSVFYFSRVVIPLMRKQRSGVMITIASTAGKRANGLVPIYSATKFAARGLAQALDRSLEGTGVRSITIAPAGINTAMRIKLFGKTEAATQQSPEEVAVIIADVLKGVIEVPVGGDVEIRGGKATVFPMI
ncbi:MAG: SDR family oxidoreductase [bacterium]|nr:SDR family oxidoreductase [bacterium]MDZ4285303.1 SDR family oxidoreductase [Candidatus Sungbacteria bacterium]